MFLRRRLLGEISGVAVCVHNRANTLNRLRLDAGRGVGVGIKRQRDTPVAQVPDSQRLQAGPVERSLKALEHDAELDEAAVRLGENAVGVLPQVAYPSRLLSRSGLEAQTTRVSSEARIWIVNPIRVSQAAIGVRFTSFEEGFESLARGCDRVVHCGVQRLAGGAGCGVADGAGISQRLWQWIGSGGC